MRLLPLLALLALLALFTLAACNRGEESSPQHPQPPQPSQKAPSKIVSQPAAASKELVAQPVLSAPMTAHLVETPAEAVPIWRESRDGKPVLVLFANLPFTESLPAQ